MVKERFNLDIEDGVSSVMIDVKQGDSARVLLATISKGGLPLKFGEGETPSATMYANMGDSTYSYGCTITEDNVIQCTLPSMLTEMSGIVECNFRIATTDGREDFEVTTPIFYIRVTDRVYVRIE